jgi:hypothetical protein
MPVTETDDIEDSDAVHDRKRSTGKRVTENRLAESFLDPGHDGPRHPGVGSGVDHGPVAELGPAGMTGLAVPQDHVAGRLKIGRAHV